MNNEIFESLDRGAREGAAMFPGRVDGVVAPARSRVRRARTMRAVGTGAVASVLVGVAAVGVAWGGGPDGVAPAVSPSGSGSPAPSMTAEGDPRVATDRLALSASPRERGVPADGERQEALVCSGPDASPDVHEFVFAECAPVWVGDAAVVDTGATISVNATGTVVTIAWELTNVSEEPIVLNQDAIAVALTTDPGALSTGGSVSAARLWDTSLWLSDTTRAGLLTGGGDRIMLASHEIMSGVATFNASAPAEGDEPDAVHQIATGEAEPWVTLQVPLVSTAEECAQEAACEPSSFLLEATTRPANAEAAKVAQDLLGVAQPRNAEDFDRGAAQAGLDCQMDPALNPRVSESDQDARYVTCDAVWLSEESPLVELRDMTFDFDSVSGDVTVNWTAANVSGVRMQLDLESVVVAIETAPNPRLAVSTWARVSDAGSLVADTFWVAPTQRYGYLSPSTSIGELEPHQLFGGSTTVSGLSEEDLSGISAALMVRVPARDDLDGSQEVLLEVPWAG